MNSNPTTRRTIKALTIVLNSPAGISRRDLASKVRPFGSRLSQGYPVIRRLLATCAGAVRLVNVQGIGTLFPVA